MGNICSLDIFKGTSKKQDDVLVDTKDDPQINVLPPYVKGPSDEDKDDSDDSQPFSDPEQTELTKRQKFNQKFNSSQSLPSSYKAHRPQRKKVSKSDFKWITKIGSGTYGEVFLVEDQMKKKYAMKILRKANILDRKLEGYTQLEQQILRSNKCKFLVDLKYSFQSKVKVYFLMEYLEGGDLYKLLKQVKRFTFEQTRFIVAQVALGIRHMHETLSIKYRDLKPENILLTRDGYVKLTDFGLAKSFKEKTDISKTFVGTLEYQAPEIIFGKGNSKDVDLWALGVLIYELLEGLPPFYHPSRNQFKVREQIQTNKPRFPSHFNKSSIEIISKLLVTEPTQRLGSQDFDEIFLQPFFNGFDFASLNAGTMESPIKQAVSQKIKNNNYSNASREICETPEPYNLKNLEIPNISYNQDDSINKITQQSPTQLIV